jgi:hypothetical protein
LSRGLKERQCNLKAGHKMYRKRDHPNRPVHFLREMTARRNEWCVLPKPTGGER